MLQKTNRLVCLSAATLFIGVMLSTSTAHGDTIVAWGRNDVGQLGNGTTINANVPVPVLGLPAGDVRVAAGGAHNLAIVNGAVFAWGNNFSGQLGGGPAGAPPFSSLPGPVTSLDSGVTAVAGGGSFSVALRAGALWAWGSNSYGALGIGSGSSVATNVPVVIPRLNAGVTAVASGFYHSLAIQNGAVFGWGRNDNGQVGVNPLLSTAVPLAITTLASGVTAISAGNDFSLAIQGGGVKSWGSNAGGQLGDGSSTLFSPTPRGVTGLTTGVIAICAGGGHALAIKDGDVYAWGASPTGQVGNGATVMNAIPVKVLDLAVAIVDVAADLGSSYALDANGNLWVWGENMGGQLGLGNTTQYNTPQLLEAPPGYLYTSIDANSSGKHVVATLAVIPEPTNLTAVVLAFPALLTRRRR